MASADLENEELRRLNKAAAIAHKTNRHLASRRPELVIKHLPIILGVTIAYVLGGPPLENSGLRIVAGLLTIFTMSLANCVLGEWVRQIDLYPPRRRAGFTLLSLCLFGIFAATGLALACQLEETFLWTAVLLLFSGLVYQTSAIWLQGVPYLNAASDSVNNPILFTLGWAMIDASSLPPVSLVFACWIAGVFLVNFPRGFDDC
ncbi:hypothetical protein EHS39_25485 [Ensifer sp. MPMI2T]|nr:hypothetical protein EHS39_25485 [Ensifer sp. MPMI2T]